MLLQGFGMDSYLLDGNQWYVPSLDNKHKSPFSSQVSSRSVSQGKIDGQFIPAAY